MFIRKFSSILIVHSSGGSGLLQAANAKEEAIRRIYPDAKIFRVDLLKDWLWKWIGHNSADLWDHFQRSGNVKALVALIRLQGVFDTIFWPILFFQVFRFLWKEGIEHVIDTQPMGTSATIKAIRLYNRLQKKRVILEKVIVDLPTRASTHFFKRIKALSDKDKKYLKIVTIEPLLENEETEEAFWQDVCGVGVTDVTYEKYPIRDSFLQYRDKKRGKEKFTIKIRYKNTEELSLMRKTIEKGSITISLGKGCVEFTILPTDKVITILLGSNPSSNAIYDYISNLIKFLEFQGKDPIHLFVFCSEHKLGEKSLYKKVYELVTQHKNYPKHLTVIPVSFQADDVVASLFYRSDITITRSGGQTLMELICIMKGKILIHSEAKLGEDLLSGIPGWEGGSAVYMTKLHGASIVTPQTFEIFVKENFFQEKGLLVGDKVAY